MQNGQYHLVQQGGNRYEKTILTSVSNSGKNKKKFTLFIFAFITTAIIECCLEVLIENHSK